MSSAGFLRGEKLTPYQQRIMPRTPVPNGRKETTLLLSRCAAFHEHALTVTDSGD